MIVFPDLEAAAVLLGGNPDYRVLRRFVPRTRYTPETVDGVELKVGLYVDVETTGLDVTRDQIIELGLVPFEFDHCGNVYAVGAGASFFNDPGVPIPAEVAALTGITDEMVRGQTITWERVDFELNAAALVVAHHADFDRKILERERQGFIVKPWACSYRDVEWEHFGCVGGRLVHILEGTCREFYEAHRAVDDCRVGVHVLASAQIDGRTALSYLLESARRPSYRLWILDTPYDFNMTLKQRGRYRWSGGEDGRRRGWYRDGTIEEAEQENAWLVSQGVRPIVQRQTAMDRYSARVG